MRFLSNFVPPLADDAAAVLLGSGVAELPPARPFPILASASWNGSAAFGCATSALACKGGARAAAAVDAVGAFLKLGNFCLGFGAEKKDESTLASFAATTFSFFTFTCAAAAVVRAFLAGGALAFAASSASFLLLDLSINF